MRGKKARRIRRLRAELISLRESGGSIERRRELIAEIARVKSKGARING